MERPRKLMTGTVAANANLRTGKVAMEIVTLVGGITHLGQRYDCSGKRRNSFDSYWSSFSLMVNCFVRSAQRPVAGAIDVEGQCVESHLTVAMMRAIAVKGIN